MPLRPLLALALLAGCASPTGLDDDDAFGGGKADGITAALEGTREGYGVLRLLNDGEGTTFTFLDDVVQLDRRAAENLIAHRDGEDGTYGTADDDVFETIGEVDEVRWVGPSALETLREFALYNDYVPGDHARFGTFDGVDFTFLEAELVLEYANDASEADLADASVPSRAITSIVEARPIDSIETLAGLYWVGTATLGHLILAAAGEPAPVACMTSDDCPGALRCIGRPSDHPYGMCRDLTRLPGEGASCEADAECERGLVCVGTTVYGTGSCSPAWMRGRFEEGGAGGIPPVVMTEPSGRGISIIGLATVPEDIIVEIDLEHSDPSSLWIGLQPPTGQEPVTLWDGDTMTGPVPSRFVDRAVYRDDAVNGTWYLLVQNVHGRGEGVLGGITLEVSSRWD